MARDGHWEVWQGMWISTAILAPLGVYVTYKAMNDSAVFNPDAWKNYFRKLVGTHETRVVAQKEVIIDEISFAEAAQLFQNIKDMAQSVLDNHSKKQSYIKYYTKGFDMSALIELSESLEFTIDYMTNCRDKMIVNKLLDFPLLRRLWIYRPAKSKWLGYTLATIFPIGIPLYLIGISQHKQLKQEIRTIIKVSTAVMEMIDNSASR